MEKTLKDESTPTGEEDRVESTSDASLETAERVGDAEAATKTVEEWAECKGLYPQMIAAPGGQSIRVNPTVDRNGAPVYAVNMRRDGGIAPRTNPKYARFAGAKAMFQWPIGKTMTEADFDKAITAANEGVTLR